MGNDLVDYYPVEADQVELVDEYTELMVDQCVTLVGVALARLAPAGLEMLMIGMGAETVVDYALFV